MNEIDKFPKDLKNISDTINLCKILSKYPETFLFLINADGSFTNSSNVLLMLISNLN